jgi:hypothetical protein
MRKAAAGRVSSLVNKGNDRVRYLSIPKVKMADEILAKDEENARILAARPLCGLHHRYGRAA